VLRQKEAHVMHYVNYLLLFHKNRTERRGRVVITILYSEGPNLGPETAYPD
jgi:hypothetical protein